jgi:hypothetical protein
MAISAEPSRIKASAWIRLPASRSNIAGKARAISLSPTNPGEVEVFSLIQYTNSRRIICQLGAMNAGMHLDAYPRTELVA